MEPAIAAPQQLCQRPKTRQQGLTCQYFSGASHLLESSSGIPNDGYTLQPFAEVICFVMPPRLVIAVALHRGADLILSDRV